MSEANGTAGNALDELAKQLAAVDLAELDSRIEALTRLRDAIRAVQRAAKPVKVRDPKVRDPKTRIGQIRHVLEAAGRPMTCPEISDALGATGYDRNLIAVTVRNYEERLFRRADSDPTRLAWELMTDPEATGPVEDPEPAEAAMHSEHTDAQS